MLRGIVQPLLEPASLLVPADVQEELHDDDAVLGQQLLEPVDLVVAARPHVLGHQLAHARDQHVLVVRSVEDGDVSSRRHGAVHAPQEIVVRLLRRGRLERRHAAALRIEAPHDVTNRSIFTRGVHPLEHDEQRAPVLGVHQVLQLVEARDTRLDLLDRRFFVEPVRVAGIPIGEGDRLPRRDDQLVAQLHLVRAPLEKVTGEATAPRTGAPRRMEVRCSQTVRPWRGTCGRRPDARW